MSLFMPLTTDQYHAKPMAISSITSPISRSREDVSSAATASATAADTTATAGPDYNDVNSSPPLTCGSPSISSSQSDTITPPTAGSSSSKSGSSSPPSRTFSNYSSSSNYSSPGSPNQSNSNLLLTKNTRSNSTSLPQPPIVANSFYHPYHYSGSSNSSSSNNNTTQPPLSIHERRLRNKTASAKYRAKKNQQHGEMRAMISTLTKENELLLRQLDHIQHENSHLKATCDRLRGKIMAQKMLKQYLVENEQHQQQQQQHHHRQQQQMSMDQGHQQPPNCFVQYHNAAPIVSSNSKYPEMNKEKRRGDLNIRSQNEAMNFH
ncbi:uncharacterized protein ATC70_007898 [Mucor velutinosus]|uniref:BZIP domain-containing protein n=1 Tax=Mucor velutinosus TaxID=708070 RepID=A0AAN7D7W5_9FUNG|nr:hypothetical protein ATC70_007898 [Mucor velutinosus]